MEYIGSRNTNNNVKRNEKITLDNYLSILYNDR